MDSVGVGAHAGVLAPTSMASVGVANHFYRAQEYVSQSGADSSSSDDPSARLEDEEWVGCDSCSKWRKVPSGFQFDRNKSFFCNMIESLTCDTPEEQWDDKEEFDHIIDDRSNDRNDSSRSTTPRGSGGGDSRRSGGGGKRAGGSISKELSAAERANGKRKCCRPRSYGAEGEGGGDARFGRAKRAGNGEEAGSEYDVRNDSSGHRANRGRTEGPASGGGVQGMSRLDAVVRVLKATGKALHYNIITRQALQQGIIRFTGSQGTAGESMKAFLNKTIRENKTAAIVNMGKGVYGLKEWGRSGAAKEGPVAAVKDEVLFEAPVSAPSRSDSSDAETAQEVECAGATPPEALDSSVEEAEAEAEAGEEEVSAPASPADTSLAAAVFPRAATPTDLGVGGRSPPIGIGGATTYTFSGGCMMSIGGRSPPIGKEYGLGVGGCHALGGSGGGV